MKARQALKLALILIGIYQFLIAISSIISAVGIIVSSMELGVYYFMSYFGIPILFVVLGSILIYKTDWIINKLRLDHDFLESELSIDHHHFEMVLKGGIILFSLSLIVNAFPSSFLTLIEFMRSKVSADSPDSMMNPMVVGRPDVDSIMRLFIGLIMLFNSGRLSRWTIKYNHLNEDE